MKQNVPVGAEAGPVCVEDVAELGAAVLLEQLLERPAMVQREDAVGADELLDEQRRGADFAAGVLGGVFRGGRGELREVDGLSS